MEFKDASIIHDVIPGGEVLAQAGLLNINTILMQSHLSWTGRVLRMPNHRLPVKLFYGEILHEKCSHEGQMKCVKDTLINTLHQHRYLGTDRHGPGQMVYLYSQGS